MKRNLISLFLTLAMVYGLTVTSFAAPDEEIQPDLQAVTFPNVTSISGDLVLNDLDEMGLVTIEEPLLYAFSVYKATDQADAARYVREQLVKHADPIAVSMPVATSTTANQMAEFKACIANALEHTGTANEGDFLRYNLNGGSTSVITAGSGRATFTYSPNYRMTEAQQKSLGEKVDLITYSFGFTSSTTDYEKVRAIYDYLCTHVSYASDTLDTGVSHSTYAALNLEETVCQGYATAFYRLALESGLDARVVTGVGYGGDHAWDIVKIDGKWYSLDVTWDASQLQKAGTGYSYFLKGTNSGEFPDHTAGVDANGDTIDYIPAELSQVSKTSYSVPLEILIQPQDIYTYLGSEEMVSVTAVGTGDLSYEWVITLPNGGNLSLDSYGFQTEEISEDNLWLYDGMSCCCKITDASGSSVISSSMTISVLDDTDARLAGYTASFEGDIAMNFYMDLSSEVISSGSAYMLFTIPGETAKTVKVPVSEAVPKKFTVNGTKVTYYRFKAGTAAKDMSQQIHAQFYLDPNTKVLDRYYSVKEYADYIIDNPDTYGEKAVNMIQAMLNYGGYAQINFNYHTNDLANIDLVDVSVPEVSLDDSVAYSTEGDVSWATYKGSQLVLRTNTLIWHYVQITGDVSDYTFKVDGTVVTPTAAAKYGSNWYRIEISGVPAKQLDHFYTLTVAKKDTSDTLTVNYCVYSNIKSIIDNSSSYTEANLNMMKTLYVFGEKTKVYFA